MLLMNLTRNNMEALPKKWKKPLQDLPKNWRQKLPELPKKQKSTSKEVLFKKKIRELPEKEKSEHINGNTVRSMTEETIEKVLERDDYCCVVCKRNSNLERPHHAFFWLEANRWEDRNEYHQLVTICIPCHYDIHSKWDTEKRELCKDYLRNIYNHNY